MSVSNRTAREEAADSTSAIFVTNIKEEASFKLYLGIMITNMFKLRPSQKVLSWKNSRCKADNDVCELIWEIEEDWDARDDRVG